MTYRIVKAAPDEATEATVGELHEACFGRDDYWDRDAEWWLANDYTGGAVAFAGLRSSRLEGGGYLCRAGVHPLVRGNGLQSKLIDARIRWARKNGLRFLVTDTVLGNYHSANNLINRGFRMFSPIAPWGLDNSSYWRLDLT